LNLKTFFEEHDKVAIAFSGGVDSAYLLYAAKKYATDVCAYYVSSVFQPKFELEDAKRLVEIIDVPMKILEVDILQDSMIVANPKDRCYFCKKKIFGTILIAARNDGYEVILDGTNASDDSSDRPGMRVLKELSVYSPLQICGLNKEDIRRLSKEAGLFTWNKPAYACLATRIATDEKITVNKLSTTEKAEEYLKRNGYIDIRARLSGNTVRLQFSKEQLERAVEQKTKMIEDLGSFYPGCEFVIEERIYK